MATINFAFTDSRLLLLPEIYPEPILNNVPKWYLDIPNKIFGGNMNSKFDYLNKTKTIKTCPSFIDIFQEGYVIKAPQDYLLYYDKETENYKWESATLFDTKTYENDTPNQVSFHGNIQMVDYLPKNSNTIFIFKIILPINIFTKKGYSTRIIPMPYQYNSDWESSYGVYKTDYIHQLNIQLQIKTNKKEILIKQGTPLCVVIPFKREKHSYKIIDINKNKKLLNLMNRHKLLFDGKFNKQYYINKWHKE